MRTCRGGVLLYQSPFVRRFRFPLRAATAAAAVMMGVAVTMLVMMGTPSLLLLQSSSSSSYCRNCNCVSSFVIRRSLSPLYSYSYDRSFSLSHQQSTRQRPKQRQQQQAESWSFSSSFSSRTTAAWSTTTTQLSASAADRTTSSGGVDDTTTTNTKEKKKKNENSIPQALASEGDWSAYLDEQQTGLLYYFNARTGESRWLPPTMTFPAVKLSRAQKRQADATHAEYKKAVQWQQKQSQTSLSSQEGSRSDREQGREKKGWLATLLGDDDEHEDEDNVVTNESSSASSSSVESATTTTKPKEEWYDFLSDQRQRPASSSSSSPSSSPMDGWFNSLMTGLTNQFTQSQPQSQPQPSQSGEDLEMTASSETPTPSTMSSSSATTTTTTTTTTKPAPQASSIVEKVMTTTSPPKEGKEEVTTVSEIPVVVVPVLPVEMSAVVLPDPQKLFWGGEDATLTSGRTFGVFDGVSGAEKRDGLPLYSLTLAKELHTRVVAAMSHIHEKKTTTTKNNHKNNNKNNNNNKANAAATTLAAGLEFSDMIELLTQVVAIANERATGASTALIGSISTAGILRIVNVGDCTAVVIRRKSDNGSSAAAATIVARTKEMNHFYECPYQFSEISPDRPRDGTRLQMTLKKGDIIIAGSDGVFDNLTEQQIVEEVMMADNGKSATATSSSVSVSVIAKRVCDRARKVSQNPKAVTPFSKLALQKKNPDYPDGVGGKVDDICCVAVRYG